MVTIEIAGYELDPDRLYDARTHMWVELQEAGESARVGMDPLGQETSGDVVALSLAPPGAQLLRGETFGDLEAAKFVGPLISPVSGMVALVNDEVLGQPGLLNGAAGRHWLVEIALAPSARDELGELLTGADVLEPWFTAEVKRFRTQGAIAE